MQGIAAAGIEYDFDEPDYLVRVGSVTTDELREPLQWPAGGEGGVSPSPGIKAVSCKLGGLKRKWPSQAAGAPAKAMPKVGLCKIVYYSRVQYGIVGLSIV